MRAIINFLLNPFNWLLIAFLIILIQVSRRAYKKASLYFIFTMILLFITSTSFLPNFLLKRLEYHHSFSHLVNDTCLSNTKYIVVLGAGHSDSKDLNGIDLLTERALFRLAKGVSLHLQNANSKLVVSGYAGKANITQAQAMADAAISLGVSLSNIILLDDGSNTLTEVKSFKNRFPDEKKIILVTDAIHMRRAIYLFNSADIKPIPAPTNYRNKHGTKKYWLEWIPSTGHFESLHMALHEYVGLIAAKIEHHRIHTDS